MLEFTQSLKAKLVMSHAPLAVESPKCAQCQICALSKTTALTRLDPFPLMTKPNAAMRDCAHREDANQEHI